MQTPRAFQVLVHHSDQPEKTLSDLERVLSGRRTDPAAGAAPFPLLKAVNSIYTIIRSTDRYAQLSGCVLEVSAVIDALKYFSDYAM